MHMDTDLLTSGRRAKDSHDRYTWPDVLRARVAFKRFMGEFWIERGGSSLVVVYTVETNLELPHDSRHGADRLPRGLAYLSKVIVSLSDQAPVRCKVTVDGGERDYAENEARFATHCLKP